MKPDIELLKWFNGGLAGFCAAFFLALLSSNKEVDGWLLGSLCCFSITLPIFVAYTLFCILTIELRIPEAKILKLTTSKRAVWSGLFAYSTVGIGFVSLVIHFSGFAGIMTFIFGIISFFFLCKDIEVIKGTIDN